MAFTLIQQAEIDVRTPVTQSLFQKLKDNFDDHEARILDNESKIQTLQSQLIITALIFGG